MHQWFIQDEQCMDQPIIQLVRGFASLMIWSVVVGCIVMVTLINLVPTSGLISKRAVKVSLGSRFVLYECVCPLGASTGLRVESVWDFEMRRTLCVFHFLWSLTAAFSSPPVQAPRTLKSYAGEKLCVLYLAQLKLFSGLLLLSSSSPEYF